MAAALVLGIVQDAGFPHVGCNAPPCANLRRQGLRERVACLGLYDGEKRFLIDATPDFPAQHHTLTHHETNNSLPLSGVLLTHAHIGHYTGLMYLGREGMNAKEVPVYCTEAMGNFLRTNAPWSQLVKFKNVVLVIITPGKPLELSHQLTVTALLLPHRNEFADTVGYIIKGIKRSLLYIPDIDSWDAWSEPLESVLSSVSYALLDATFSSLNELPMATRHAEVPHPLVQTTMDRLARKPELAKRVHFTHLNHTNPLLWDEAAQSELRAKGFGLAKVGQIFEL